MGEKIKSKQNLFIFTLLILLLMLTRLLNLSWSLPYPMHPDERNMAIAIEQLNCQLPKVELIPPKSLLGEWKTLDQWVKIDGDFKIEECFNPRFFAYGQLPLYLGYIVANLIKLLNQDLTPFINLYQSTLSLRIISAFSSILTAFVMFKIINLFINEESNNSNDNDYGKDFNDKNIKNKLANKIKSNKKNNFSLLKSIITGLIIVFSPYAIQFSHFGTTESLLMLFYTVLVYQTILFVINKKNPLHYVFYSSLILGMAIGTKASSLIFTAVPLMALFFRKNQKFSFFYFFLTKIFDIFVLGFLTLIFTFIFSPHNLINFKEFLGSMNYESDVALGRYVAFYTRQFVGTTPVIFQITKIFPYVLGIGTFVLSILGIFFLSWKDKKINVLRLFFFSYFLPTSFIFAKWTRFMAPVFPILTLFAILLLTTMIEKINKNIFSILITVLTFFLLIPGINYLTIYQHQDTRLQATEWINNNIENNSYILSETANVVDIPVENKNNLKVISFNFYDLDESLLLQEELKNHIDQADYIFVPSRRIFANINNQYPKLSEYYDNLFSGKLGFKKVAEFSSTLNDEDAEETWTVFDHPVIRIYKRI